MVGLMMEADKVLPGPGNPEYKPEKKGSKKGSKKGKPHPLLGDIFKDMDLGSIKRQLDDLGITKLPVDKDKK